MTNNERLGASFRDPSGFLFSRAGILYRQINRSYAANYDLLMSSGLYDKLIKLGLLVPHREADEIGREQGEMFLQAHGRARTHLDVMDFKDLLAFFVSGFNRLASIVVVKPARQICGDILLAEVYQARKSKMWLRPSSALPETFVAQVERIREILQIERTIDYVFLTNSHIQIIGAPCPSRSRLGKSPYPTPYPTPYCSATRRGSLTKGFLEEKFPLLAPNVNQHRLA
jgi:hypothetical protein